MDVLNILFTGEKSFSNSFPHNDSVEFSDAHNRLQRLYSQLRDSGVSAHTIMDLDTIANEITALETERYFYAGLRYGAKLQRELDIT